MRKPIRINYDGPLQRHPVSLVPCRLLFMRSINWPTVAMDTATPLSISILKISSMETASSTPSMLSTPRSSLNLVAGVIAFLGDVKLRYNDVGEFLFDVAHGILASLTKLNAWIRLHTRGDPRSTRTPDKNRTRLSARPGCRDRWSRSAGHSKDQRPINPTVVSAVALKNDNVRCSFRADPRLGLGPRRSAIWLSWQRRLGGVRLRDCCGLGTRCGSLPRLRRSSSLASAKAFSRAVRLIGPAMARLPTADRLSVQRLVGLRAAL